MRSITTLPTRWIGLAEPLSPRIELLRVTPTTSETRSMSAAIVPVNSATPKNAERNPPVAVA